MNHTFEGRWQEHDRDTVLDAVAVVDCRLSERLGVPPFEAWSTVYHIPVVFRAVDSIAGGYHGHASGRLVRLVRGKVTERLVIHELGHVYHYERVKRQRSYYHAPVATLSRSGLLAMVDAGVMHREHPATMTGGRTAAECWADVFMAWVTRSFADNDAGRSLYQFVERMILVFRSDEK